MWQVRTLWYRVHLVWNGQCRRRVYAQNSLVLPQLSTGGSPESESVSPIFTRSQCRVDDHDKKLYVVSTSQERDTVKESDHEEKQKTIVRAVRRSNPHSVLIDSTISKVMFKNSTCAALRSWGRVLHCPRQGNDERRTCSSVVSRRWSCRCSLRRMQCCHDRQLNNICQERPKGARVWPNTATFV